MKGTLLVFGLFCLTGLTIHIALVDEPNMLRLIPLVLGVGSLIVSISQYAMDYGKKQRELEQKILQGLKAEYDSTLDYLEKNPNDPKARVACLDKGRIYYEALMPDTMTVHYRDGIPVGTSNHQNNAVSREARINSDIEARIGHLKFQKETG